MFLYQGFIILRGHKGRARTERLKKIQDTIKEKTILSNIAQPKLTTNKRYYADAIEEPSFKRQFIKIQQLRIQ